MSLNNVLLALLLGLLLPCCAHSQTELRVDPRWYLAELGRLSACKAFLQDSPDVYLEPQSVGKFFKQAVYQKLRGNAYFGYRYDEGFRLEGGAAALEQLKDLAPGQPYEAGFRVALEQSLKASGLELKDSASQRIGVCIVGVEPRQSSKTLPGIMVEAYLRNTHSRKSFFIRYGAGHPRGLPAAIRLSAEMLVAQLCSKGKTNECSSAR